VYCVANQRVYLLSQLKYQGLSRDARCIACNFHCYCTVCCCVRPTFFCWPIVSKWQSQN